MRSSLSYCSGERRNSIRAVHFGDGPGLRAALERGLRLFRVAGTAFMSPIVHARKFCARITHIRRTIRVDGRSVLHDRLSSRRQHARFRPFAGHERATLAIFGSIRLDKAGRISCTRDGLPAFIVRYSLVKSIGSGAKRPFSSVENRQPIASSDATPQALRFARRAPRMPLAEERKAGLTSGAHADLPSLAELRSGTRRVTSATAQPVKARIPWTGSEPRRSDSENGKKKRTGFGPMRFLLPRRFRSHGRDRSPKIP